VAQSSGYLSLASSYLDFNKVILSTAFITASSRYNGCTVRKSRTFMLRSQTINLLTGRTTRDEANATIKIPLQAESGAELNYDGTLRPSGRE
jgi:hypothetical protein